MTCNLFFITDYSLIKGDEAYLFIISPIYKNIKNRSISNISLGTFSGSETLSNSYKLAPDGLTPLPDYIDQALIGLLLGDGTLVKKYKGGGTYFKYAQGTNHTDYLYFLFNLFKEMEIVNMNKPYFGTSKVKGKSYHYYSFTTRSLKVFNNLHSSWYPSGVKVIPEKISEFLSPISLAYWLMDDGGWTKKGIHLNTNFFNLSDVERLVEILADKFGLKCSVHSRNRVYI